MFHITGMVSMMHCNIVLGATMVLLPRWDREVAGRLISQYRVTHWTNIPTMVIDLMGSPNYRSFDLSSLVYRWRRRGHASGRGPAAQGRVRPVHQEGYGLTETAAPLAQQPL
jgi:fatty-acyl-CoA synthase